MVNFRLATSALALVGASVFLVSKQGNATEGSMNRFLRAEEGESNRRQLGFFDPKTIKRKIKANNEDKPAVEGMLAVVISTPKCGTGGLTNTFARSFHCHPQDDKDIGEVSVSECQNDNTVIRSHDLEEATAVLRAFRAEKPHQKCVVVTGIRDPEPWIPSMFMQSKQAQDLCDADISREDFFAQYHNWLMDNRPRLTNAVKEVRPGLLKEFNSRGLSYELEQMKQNGGYSILSAEQTHPESPFAGCDMLFLRMEDSKNWPEIIQNTLPGVTYETNPSRTDRCPKIADHYKALSKTYKLSPEEKMHLVAGDPEVAEYFQVYGHEDLGEIGNDAIPETGKEGTLALVINTPKCGTGGLSKTLQLSYGCDPKQVMQIGSSQLNNCANGNHVVRTHNLESGTRLFEKLRTEHSGADQQRCVIVTAIRDPRTWMPSMWMQTPAGNALCEADISREVFFKEYHDWIMVNGPRIQNAVSNVRPPLLAEFGAQSLTTEMQRVDQNGGYSILDQPNPQGIYANCQLLFLQMEHSENWAQIMAQVMPGVEYRKNKARTEVCPKIADHYSALTEYVYSQEELAILSDNGRNTDVLEYFSVYGM